MSDYRERYTDITKSMIEVALPVALPEHFCEISKPEYYLCMYITYVKTDLCFLGVVNNPGTAFSSSLFYLGTSP